MAHVIFSDSDDHGHGPPFCPPPFADGDWPGHANPPPLRDLCPNDLQAVPEPETIALLAIGLVLAALWRKVYLTRSGRRPQRRDYVEPPRPWPRK